MKNLVIVIGLLCVLSTGTMAQVEQGDKEVQLLGSIIVIEDASLWLLMGSYGVFVTPKTELGVGPSIWHAEVYGFGTTVFGATFFGRHHFTVAQKQVPYISALWNQGDFDPEFGDFFDYSYVQFGAGMKFFISEHVAYDASANLGFSLGLGTAVMTIMGGLSAFF